MSAPPDPFKLSFELRTPKRYSTSVTAMLCWQQRSNVYTPTMCKSLIKKPKTSFHKPRKTRSKLTFCPFLCSACVTTSGELQPSELVFWAFFLCFATVQSDTVQSLVDISTFWKMNITSSFSIDHNYDFYMINTDIPHTILAALTQRIAFSTEAIPHMIHCVSVASLCSSFGFCHRYRSS